MSELDETIREIKEHLDNATRIIESILADYGIDIEPEEAEEDGQKN